mmetsp:Transcript_41127/g.113363  ORF Transcript_41127/g.113363 Transcript_41127/m.113363 type:complete len:325 (-) Transcript_41127:375-1349(-)
MASTSTAAKDAKAATSPPAAPVDGRKARSQRNAEPKSLPHACSWQRLRSTPSKSGPSRSSATLSGWLSNSTAIQAGANATSLATGTPASGNNSRNAANTAEVAAMRASFVERGPTSPTAIARAHSGIAMPATRTRRRARSLGSRSSGSHGFLAATSTASLSVAVACLREERAAASKSAMANRRLAPASSSSTPPSPVAPPRRKQDRNSTASAADCAFTSSEALAATRCRCASTSATAGVMAPDLRAQCFSTWSACAAIACVSAVKSNHAHSSASSASTSNARVSPRKRPTANARAVSPLAVLTLQLAPAANKHRTVVSRALPHA